jgi:hypothetical protein
MSKIPKNRSDQEMLVNFKEKVTFENDHHDEEITKASPKTNKKEAATTSFFAPEIQEKVGKLLLEIKVKLYKEGIVDYDIKVARDGNQVTLTAVPKVDSKKGCRY